MDKTLQAALILLASWLPTAGGCDAVVWTFDSTFVDGMPVGKTAKITIELVKNEKDKEYEKCGKCWQMHEKGAPCPYSRTSVL